MESTFVWILMSAGVLVAILGAILVTSERELKAKRRQIEELLTKLENSPEAAVAAAIPSQADHGAELSELQARNRDLENRLQAVSGKLELSRRTVDELQATQASDAVDPAGTERLRVANDQLQAQVNELRGQLAASEAQFHNSASRNQDNQEDHTSLQAESVKLRQELEASQHKIRELEAVQRNLPDVDAIEAGHRQERQSLQERIAELERRLLADQELLSEAQALRQRLIEAEESQKSLRDEIRRHDEEIPRWQARIAEGEEHRQRLAALRAPFDDLLSKQAALAEQQRGLREDLSAFARLMAASGETMQTTSAPPTAAQEPVAAAGQPEARRARSYGILSLLLLLAATGAAAFQFLGSESAQTPTTTASASVEKLDTRPESRNELPAAPDPELAAPEAQPVSEAPPAKQTLAKPAVNEYAKTISRAPQTAKPATQVAGTFQVTRPSRVYAAPSEYSRPIGDIEPGVKVNVVDARNGWFEIHSKHGRPPGFIRREVAARVSSRN